MKNHINQFGYFAIKSLRGLAIAGAASAVISLGGAATALADSSSLKSAEGQNGSGQNASLPRAGAQLGQAIETPRREYLIKAAILYNFAKFAEWPADAFANDSAPLQICVLGRDPFGPALDSLSGKHARDRSLKVARIAKLSETGRCHILFVSESEKSRLPKILKHMEKLPVLTVADFERFADAGGVIALRNIENRSRIVVNIAAAERAGLKLSSKLLRLADQVGSREAKAQVPSQ